MELNILFIYTLLFHSRVYIILKNQNKNMTICVTIFTIVQTFLTGVLVYLEVSKRVKSKMEN